MKMKFLLRLLATVSLTGLSATSVVACGGKTANTEGMNAKVAQHLNLVDADGHGLQAASLKANGDKVEWSVPANESSTKIKANLLLKTPNADSESQDDASYDFITKVLNIQPKTGKTFDYAALQAIEGKVTDIKPTLRVDNTSGYLVVGGNFSFQFNKTSDSTALGPKYSIALKRDNTTDVVTPTLATIISSLQASDTDVATNDKIKFSVGETVPATAIKGAVITVTKDSSDGAKQFYSLNSLLGTNITVQLETKTAATTTWAANDTLTISCKTDVFIFDSSVVKKTWTL